MGFIWISIKFRRRPRLHSRAPFLQFTQSGTPSSHFRCRSLHVKHPVLTRLDFAGVMAGGIFVGIFRAGMGCGKGEMTGGCRTVVEILSVATFGRAAGWRSISRLARLSAAMIEDTGVK